MSKKLHSESITKLLIRFSFPAMLGMFVYALYNVVDRVFVGHAIGPDGLAAITLSFPIMLVTMAFGMLIGIGGSTVVSIKLGEQKVKEAQNILGNAFILFFILSSIMTICGLIFSKEILLLVGASDTLLPMAESYFRIVICSVFFHEISFGMNSFIRSEGRPVTAMVTSLIGAGLNIILDWLFIFHFQWGIEGAAYATVIAQIVSGLFVIGFFSTKYSRIHLTSNTMKLKLNIIRQIIAIGFAPCLLALANSFIHTIINHQVSQYGGDLAISVAGVLFSISTFFMMPIMGIRQGLQPIVGYNHGAKNYHRVIESLFKAIGLSSIVCILGFIVIMIFPEPILGIFNLKSKEALSIGTKALRYFHILLPLTGFQMIVFSYYQAVGRAKTSAFLVLSRQLIFLLPSLLILPKFFLLSGVWLAAPCADIFSLILSACYFYAEKNKLQAIVAEV